MKTQNSLFVILVSVVYCCVSASTVYGEKKIQVVATGFDIPWSIKIIDEDEYLFTDRMGTLYHYQQDSAIAVKNIPAAKTFDFENTGITFGGLMEVSLHPDFRSNDLVYITYLANDYFLRVARFYLKNNKAEDLEVIFKSNARYIIGARIAWQDGNHFFSAPVWEEHQDLIQAHKT